MIVKLLTEYHLGFLSLKGGRTGSSESTHVKMPHCWKSPTLAHYYLTYLLFFCCIERILNATYVHWSRGFDAGVE